MNHEDALFVMCKKKVILISIEEHIDFLLHRNNDGLGTLVVQFNHKGKHNNTFFHHLVEYNDGPIVSRVMSLCANMFARNVFGDTPFSIALKRKLDNATNAMLPHVKLNLNKLEEPNLLHLTIEYNHRLSQHILDAGVDINAQTKAGRTALHQAILCFSSSAVSWLVERGADITLRDIMGKTALDTAIWWRFDPGIIILRATAAARGPNGIPDSHSECSFFAQNIHVLCTPSEATKILDDITRVITCATPPETHICIEETPFPCTHLQFMNDIVAPIEDTMHMQSTQDTVNTINALRCRVVVRETYLKGLIDSHADVVRHVYRFNGKRTECASHLPESVTKTTEAAMSAWDNVKIELAKDLETVLKLKNSMKVVVDELHKAQEKNKAANTERVDLITKRLAVWCSYHHTALTSQFHSINALFATAVSENLDADADHLERINTAYDQSLSRVRTEIQEVEDVMKKHSIDFVGFKASLPHTSSAMPATPAASSSNPKVDDTLCVVCLDSPKTLALTPCGHYCLCSDCWKKFTKPANCPICRTPVENTMKIFHA